MRGDIGVLDDVSYSQVDVGSVGDGVVYGGEEY
jgi:hypothetical protein